MPPNYSPSRYTTPDSEPQSVFGFEIPRSSSPLSPEPTVDEINAVRAAERSYDHLATRAVEGIRDTSEFTVNGQPFSVDMNPAARVNELAEVEVRFVPAAIGLKIEALRREHLAKAA